MLYVKGACGISVRRLCVVGSPFLIFSVEFFNSYETTILWKGKQTTQGQRDQSVASFGVVRLGKTFIANPTCRDHISQSLME